jgi:hypothetical protein
MLYDNNILSNIDYFVKKNVPLNVPHMSKVEVALSHQKKPPQKGGFAFFIPISRLNRGRRLRFPPLDVLDHLARLQAGSAHHHPFWGPVNKSSNSLQVRHKAPFGDIMGMGNVIAEHRLFPTDFAHFRHRKPQSSLDNRPGIYTEFRKRQAISEADRIQKQTDPAPRSGRSESAKTFPLS